ncbi:MAG: KpsF/GutQ family sugar-phosphate isomerase [Gammaproteobacteria bacterium]|jgi:arabinose-5-phosphate isomerase|nr:KpsF/GutQ family sugar-phosphate isomerase [Gammaproteobacteria bacterium]MBT3723509.1 KpsF/GutQ family sugar-phosphate isomerase [Gammaproteobacteria bacterium]MBT4078268.1 KpsF/GutQ family sugar-phosphate isomerase [Gammaproteobacteria bacterium]MBT4194283.1 KpsF/GutQ family sugar-phosphate isomerase [Gammaproteobacteria bacterium]MBT4859720.1 KpsF/GutQ family sugar-phosphate isomerase [Gammaproteobacteria bacterium]
MTEHSYQQLGIAVLKTEADSINALIDRIDQKFHTACEMILACKGRIVVTGMGKSGHIGNKIAATLASTGTPSFFMHPGEASHGDLGMITETDLVIALSNSGEVAEIITLLPLLKRLPVPLISLTGNEKSTLAEMADINLDVGVEKEACPLGLAPTSSTTASLAMGDALAIAVLEARGFTEEDFARSHPGGSLGRRLLLRVKDIMHTGDRIPVVSSNASLKQALLEMSDKGLGMTAIHDKENHLLGIYTDGDLRRTLDSQADIQTAMVKDHMTTNCVTIDAEQIASEALNLMDSNAINALIVTNKNGEVQGALNMHDLLRAGIV